MAARNFELITPTAHKTWSIHRDGCLVEAGGAAAGKPPRMRTKEWPDEDAAIKAVAKAIRKKRKEGYFPSPLHHLPCPIDDDAAPEDQGLIAVREASALSSDYMGDAEFIEEHHRGVHFTDGPAGYRMWLIGTKRKAALHVSRHQILREVTPPIATGADRFKLYRTWPHRPDGRAIVVQTKDTLWEVEVEDATARQVHKGKEVDDLYVRYASDGTIIAQKGASVVRINEGLHPIWTGETKLLGVEPLVDGRVAALERERVTIFTLDGTVTHTIDIPSAEQLGTWLGGGVLVVSMTSEFDGVYTLLWAVDGGNVHPMPGLKDLIGRGYDRRGACWFGGRISGRDGRVFGVETMRHAALTVDPLGPETVLKPAPKPNALVRATASKSLEQATTALAEGADPEFRDGDGYTALALALHVGALDIAEHLLTHDANPGDATFDAHAGPTPLFVAAEWGREDWVARLLDAGASVDAGKGNWSSPLAEALRRRHLSTARLLLARGAS